MHEGRRTFVWISLLVLSLPGRQVAAQDNGPARSHIELGERYYRLSDYPAALREFEAAYRIDPRPDLLFNVARCHEVMANLEQAIRIYRRYLRLKPGADDRQTVELRIRNLRKRLAGTPQFRPAAPRQGREDPRAMASGEEAPGPTAPTRWKVTVGWSALAVGVALLVTGTVFGAMAEEKANEFSSGVNKGMTYTTLSEIDRTGETYQRVQIATLIVGGLVAATGGGLLLSDLRDRWAARGERIGLAPLLGPSGVGLAAGGRF